MEIRKSTKRDIDRIMEIYTYAREFMASHGNPNQWGPTNWPPESLIHQDIENGNSYVCTHNDKVIGTCFYTYGKDVELTYNVIDDGSWANESPYGVVHRIAGDGSIKGIGSFCLNCAFSQCNHLRIDTHEDNEVMQNLLHKLGFEHRGTIYVYEDHFPRLAFEKISQL